VSATAIKIAVVLTEVVGPTGNSALGVPSPAEQQDNFRWVIDSVNAAGGVACRKLVPTFFNGNPVDESQLQQTCLDIAEAGVFAVIDLAAYGLHPAAQGCFAKHQLPLITNAHGANTQVRHDYPYLFPSESIDDGNRNTVFALAARGFFSRANGFNKLGFVYTSCFPEMSGEIIGWLHKVGLSSSQIVTYDFGCPNGFASPADVQQAILKFQQAGVTHVTQNYLNVSFKVFTEVAEQQGFRPKYGIPAQSIIALNDGDTHPNYANIANAIAIAGDRQAERHTPGYVPSAGTKRCNAIFAKHGRPPAYQAQDVGASGWACASIWELAAMIGHAPALRRNALAAGLHATGSIDLPFPVGPNDFSGTKVTVGDQFWRPAQFFRSCDCWRVIDKTWHPSFK
jgi:hypothetical protein